MSCKTKSAFKIKKNFGLDNCQDFFNFNKLITSKAAAYLRTAKEKKKYVELFFL